MINIDNIGVVELSGAEELETVGGSWYRIVWDAVRGGAIWDGIKAGAGVVVEGMKTGPVNSHPMLGNMGGDPYAYYNTYWGEG